MAGLLEIHYPGQKPSVIMPALQAKVLELCRRPPKDGSAHWSCRKLAKELKVSLAALYKAVSRVRLALRRELDGLLQ